MTNYELINDNVSLIVKLVKNGYAGVEAIKHLEIYENYHALTGNKGERYKQLADKYGYNPDYVGKIIIKMNKKIQ